MKMQLIIRADRTGYSPEQISSTLSVREFIESLETMLEEVGSDGEDINVYLSHDNGYTYGGITESHLSFRESEDEEE